MASGTQPVSGGHIMLAGILIQLGTYFNRVSPGDPPDVRPRE